MAVRTLEFCDGCDKQLTGAPDRFCRIRVLTDRYADAAGSMDYGEINLVFCAKCATKRLLPSLEILAAKAKEGV